MAAPNEGGFDVDFVEHLVDRLTCPICHMALREPRITDCGHQFCWACLRPLVRDCTLTCPLCRTELKETEIYPNNMVKREILSLKIQCDKHEVGCKWQGELRRREEHNQECGHVTELCDNNCGEMVMRKDTQDHKLNQCSRRIVCCFYCDAQFEFQELAGHYETCYKYPVACRYKCGIHSIARGEMDMHTSVEGTCPNSPLQCDFASAGCSFIGDRKHLNDHLQESTATHLRFVMKSFQSTTEKFTRELAETKAVLKQRDSELEELKFVLTLS